MGVPILRQGGVLVVSVQESLTDSDLVDLQADLAEQVGRLRATGVVIDVGALDVIDSFAGRVLRNIALTARLRGAETVVVGVQPEVALAMVQLGMYLEGVGTALDLEAGLALLAAQGAR